LFRWSRLWRSAPGASFLATVLAAGLLSRLPIYPTVSMVRSFGGGGDRVSWGLAAHTVAHHLRYEVGWASHRPVAAALLDVVQPLATWLFAAVLAALLGKPLVFLSRRARVTLERTSRRALTAALPLVALILVLDRLLHFGWVHLPLRAALLGLAPLLTAILVTSVLGRRGSHPPARGPRPPSITGWLRAAFRLPLLVFVGGLAGGAAVAASLSLTVPMLSARTGLAPYTWPATAAGAVLASLVARRWRSASSRRSRSALR
jgi:hypothetical protein